MEQDIFNQVFHSGLQGIDRAAIRREWKAIQPPFDLNARRLPLPVWARRGLSDSGALAWSTLQTELSRASERQAYCIYIHIPFCANKCAFCDCYSFRLSRHRREQIEQYARALDQEMQLWSRVGSLAQRPVSTVHFGGGTPAFLGEETFRKLIEKCQRYFNTDRNTEFALESTSSELDGDMFSMLGSLGFTRLHLGVQSLDYRIRTSIDRREPAEVVLAKLSTAIAAGWITSVDLIYGLPAQSLGGLVEDIRLLSEIGVHGFSLYELQRSPRNRKFIERHGLADRDRTYDYLLLQGASQVLASLGYEKTFFNHFAREEDTDLYFTFPERGEDCLALGTIADGVFGDYHYRHPEYAAYCRTVNSLLPGLSGGVRNNARERQLAPLEVALFSGKVSPLLFAQILGKARAEELLAQWLETALLAYDPMDESQLRLTANGSWFMGEMMGQLSDRLPWSGHLFGKDEG